MGKKNSEILVFYTIEIPKAGFSRFSTFLSYL
jgi:hypothetical protein